MIREMFSVCAPRPTCDFKLKHGRNNVYKKQIKEYAFRALNDEIAPEPVDERNGDFYIIDIKLLGEDTEIYFRPEHLIHVANLVKNKKG